MSNYPGRLVLVGDPVSHSLSPAMQNAALRAAHIDLQYEALAVSHDSLPSVLEELRRLKGAGNVTIPHKRNVLELADVRSETAARAHAANTFRYVEGALHVENTDVPAFDRVARNLLADAISGARITVFGAGGAAAAILCAVEGWEGATATIFNRSRESAVRLEQAFADFARAETDIARALDGATLVVNATPAGQHDDEYCCEPSLLDPETAVFDLVYRRGGTPWVNEAARQGHPAIDGMPMLLEQGALAFREWFGFDPDREVMQQALQ